MVRPLIQSNVGSILLGAMNKLHDPSSRSLVRPSSRAAPRHRPAAPGHHPAVADAPECTMAAATEPDPLSDVLRTVRLTGALFFLWRVPWPYETGRASGRGKG